MAETKLSILVQAIDQFSRPLKTLDKGLIGLAKRAENTGARVNSALNFAVATETLSRGVDMAQNLASRAFHGFMDYEDALIGVGKTTKLTGSELEALGRQAQRMGKEIPLATTELLKLMEAGAQQGVGVRELGDFARLGSHVQVSFDLDAESAVDVLGKLRSAYGLTLDELRLAGDAMNHLSDRSRLNASQIANITARSAGATRTFGLTEIQATALAAAIGELSPNTESAATAISAWLPRLQVATRQSKSFKRGLRTAGFEASTFERKVKQDAGTALLDLIDNLSRLDSATRSGAVLDMFGSGGDSQLLLALAENQGLLAQFMKALEDPDNFRGSLLGEFESKSNSLSSALQKLKNSFERLNVSVGNVFSGDGKDFITWLADVTDKSASWIEQNPEAVKGWVKLGGAITAASIALKSFAALGFGGVVIGGVGAAVGAGGAAAGAGAAGVGAGAAGIAKGAGASLLAKGSLILASVGGVLLIGDRLVSGTWLTPEQFVAALGGLVNDASNEFQKGIDLAFSPQTWKDIGGAFDALANHAKIAAGRAGVEFQLLESKFDKSLNEMFSNVISREGGFRNAGQRTAEAFGDGIAAGAGHALAEANSLFSQIAAMTPQSPVREGPLKILNNISSNPGAKIVGMLAAGVRAASPTLQNVLGNSLQMSPVAAGATTKGGSAAFPVGRYSHGGGDSYFSMSFHFPGVGSRDEAEAIGADFDDRVRRVIQDHQHNQIRVSYG